MRRAGLPLLLSLLTGISTAAEKAFRPGELWPDNNNVHIDCHGGGMLVHGGMVYWFGQASDENARDGRSHRRGYGFFWKNRHGSGLTHEGADQEVGNPCCFGLSWEQLPPGAGRRLMKDFGLWEIAGCSAAAAIPDGSSSALPEKIEGVPTHAT